MAANGDEDHTFCLSLDHFANSPSKVQGIVEWLQAFWLPTQQRKHPSIRFDLTAADGSLQIRTSKEESIIDPSFWEKQVTQALKKVIVEDLGDMDALELWDSIPDSDKDGRGRQDLEQMQKELSVKAVFLQDRHVLLVGPKQKLTKKCFTLRNVLSHYHWRLSGKDVGR
jgi:hypothetical protein